MIRISRDSGYVDRLRAYKVILDGQVIGEIKNGQQVEFNITPGKHQLNLKIDWCRSNIVDFEMHQDIIEFDCGSNLLGFKLFMAIFYVILFHKKYIWLKMK